MINNDLVKYKYYSSSHIKSNYILMVYALYQFPFFFILFYLFFYYLEPCEKFASRQYNIGFVRSFVSFFVFSFTIYIYIYHRLDFQVIVVRYSQFVY